MRPRRWWCRPRLQLVLMEVLLGEQAKLRVHYKPSALFCFCFACQEVIAWRQRPTSLGVAKTHCGQELQRRKCNLEKSIACSSLLMHQPAHLIAAGGHAAHSSCTSQPTAYLLSNMQLALHARAAHRVAADGVEAWAAAVRQQRRRRRPRLDGVRTVLCRVARLCGEPHWAACTGVCTAFSLE